jgi:hypothetical protein
MLTEGNGRQDRYIPFGGESASFSREVGAAESPDTENELPWRRPEPSSQCEDGS